MLSANDAGNALSNSWNKFESVMKKAGLTVSHEQFQPLDVDLSEFKIALVKEVQREGDAFIDVFDEATSNAVVFRSCLVPLASRKSSSSFAGQHTSLIRILLNIDLIQTSLIDKLLERLPEYSVGDNELAMPGLSADESSITQLILSQFRWLDRAIDPTKLAEKMLEMLTCTPLDLQRDIIMSLPEVIDDRAKDVVIDAFVQMLESEQELTTPLIDGLTNLDLKPVTTNAVRSMVLDGLSSYQPEAMPVVVRFIVQSIDSKSKDAPNVLQRLRDGLALESLVVDNKDAVMEARSQIGEIATLDALKSSINYHYHILNGWLKVIDKILATKGSKLIALDLFVMLMIHGTSLQKKTIESLSARCIKKDRLSAPMIHSIFSVHGGALRAYHDSLLAIAEYLMRSPEKNCRDVSSALYAKIFNHFATFCKQDVMGALVTHIGSGNFSEVSGALDVLEELVKLNFSELHQFYIMLKQILDYVDNLALAHVRKLFFILCALGVQEDSTGQESDELHIYIRKMLGKPTLQDMRVGIVGITMLLRAYARTSPQSAESITESKLLIQLVKTHFGCTETTVGTFSADKINAAGLLYDELATLVSSVSLDSDLLGYIEETLVIFTELYLVERSANPDKCRGIEPEIAFDLDATGDDADGEVLVNILPSVLCDSGRAENMQLLCAQFNLLQAIEKRNCNGSLSEIDALAGCGLWFMPESYLLDFEGFSISEQKGIIHCYFFAINFFRELINAFAEQNDADLKLKTLNRLEHVVFLEQSLATLLKKCPSFVPLAAQFEVDVILKQKPQPKSRPSKRKINDDDLDGEDDFDDKKISKKLKAAESIDANKDESAIKQDADEDDEHQKKEALVATLDYDKFFPFFRELDLDVLGMLLGLALQESKLDTEMQTIASTTQNVHCAGPKELYYLLRDLRKKMKKLLHPPKASRFHNQGGVAAAAKNVGFGKLLTKSELELVLWTKKNIKLLCVKLEEQNEFFTDVAEAHPNIDISEPMLASIPSATDRIDCYQSIVEIFLIFFSWAGFENDIHHNTLQECLVQVASRTQQQANELSFNEVAVETFNYFNRCAENSPSISIQVAHLSLMGYLADQLEYGDDGSEFLKCTKVISQKCNESLRKVWTGISAKPIKPQHLNSILETLFNNGGDSLAYLNDLVFSGLAEIKEVAEFQCDVQEKKSAKAFISESFPTLTKSTFNVFYKNIFAQITELIGKCDFFTDESMENQSQGSKIEARIGRVIDILKIFRTLTEFCSVPVIGSNDTVIINTLKFSKSFIQAFIDKCMPLLEDSFVIFSEDVVHTLKELQKSTRLLQRLCTHYKETTEGKNSALAAHIPPLRRTLESVVFRTKGMLEANECGQALSVGNLKHKNLAGEELSSQMVPDEIEASQEGSDEGDAEAPDVNLENTRDEHANEAEAEEEEEELNDSSDEVLTVPQMDVSM